MPGSRPSRIGRAACLAVIAVAAMLLAAPPARSDPVEGVDFAAALTAGVLPRFLLVLCVAELVIVGVEALAYRQLLKLGIGTALVTSLLANIASALTGFLPDAFGQEGGVVVGLMIAVATETVIVILLNRSYANRPLLISVVALVNVCTYLTLRALLSAVVGG